MPRALTDSPKTCHGVVSERRRPITSVSMSVIDPGPDAALLSVGPLA